MIYLALCGLLFFIFGYLLKISQDTKNNQLENEFYDKFKEFRLSLNTNSNFKKKPSVFLLKNEAILINSNISSALQEIFDVLISNYISSWYMGFSNNEDFVIEVKYFFHIICTEILLRFSKIDFPALITHKMMPAVVNHIDIWCSVQNTGIETTSSVTPVQDLILQKLKTHIHVTMIGRAEEVSYLKSISKCLIPKITPDYLSQTENRICFHLLQDCFAGVVLLPMMDSLATPDFLNKLAVLLLEYRSSPSSDYSLTQSSPKVPILHRYQTAWIEKFKAQESYPRGIKNFLREDKYLYQFIQFMKSIGAVSLINFFMLMDSITLKLQNPEIDISEQGHIFKDLQQFEDLMNSTDEYSDLNISSDLHRRVKEVLRDGHQNIIQLINCEIWMENYNSICQHIESLYLAQYFESEFYLSTIYGERQSGLDISYDCEWEDINVTGECLDVLCPENVNPETISQNDSSPQHFSYSLKKMSLDLFSFDFNSEHKSPISEEQKSALSTPDKLIAPSFTFLQSIFQKEKDLIATEKQKMSSAAKFAGLIRNPLNISNDDSVDGDEIDSSEHTKIDYSVGHMNDLPDLSVLRIMIPSISQRYINAKTKTDFFYCVQTYKEDSDQVIHRVYRKFGEFYFLEQKITEFHGSIGKYLPTKKPWDAKKLDYLDSCKYELQTYLNYLVKRPFLKNSQLLCKFLTDEAEFNINTAPDINISKLVKVMPMKLMTEKGKYLEKFLVYFHGSCESTGGTKLNSFNDSTSPAASSLPDLNTQSIIDKRMHSRLFWNNAEFINVKSEIFFKEMCKFTSHYIFYWYDVACYFCQTIFGKIIYSTFFLTVLYRIRPFGVLYIQNMMNSIFKKGFEKLQHERTLVDIIHILKDATLGSGFVRTNSEKLECRDKALKGFYNLLPEWVSKITPTDHLKVINSNIERVFECFQQPKLNKQLSYVLLDILILELFPELAENFAHIQNEIFPDK